MLRVIKGCCVCKGSKELCHMASEEHEGGKKRDDNRDSVLPLADSVVEGGSLLRWDVALVGRPHSESGVACERIELIQWLAAGGGSSYVCVRVLKKDFSSSPPVYFALQSSYSLKSIVS